MTSESMMKLPLPVIVAEKSTGRILYTNGFALERGFKTGHPFDETPTDTNESPEEKSVRIAVGGRTLRAQLRETGIIYGGRDARLIALSSLRDETEALSGWDICSVFLKTDKTGSMDAFLSLTGRNAGAFCAALYEARAQRYVLRGEWRSRRSVSIPALHPDFALNVGSETEKLRQTKDAADIAALPYTKQHGTKGFAIYFFDAALNADKRERLNRFVSLYGAFAPDMPDTSRLVLHHGVDAMEQGIAVWNEATRALIFSNRAYRSTFGGGNARTISEALGKDIRGRVTHETISDGKGRYFDVTHTACGNRSQGVISTIIVDNTAYVKAQRRLDMMARIDALTGLFNRRAGLEYLERMYTRCRQQGKPLTVCFADIDGLKKINDTWGHGAGDAMIQSVAGLIRNYMADLGEACRLGGDEFVLILPDQTAAQATLLASQIGREAARCFVGGTSGITMSFGFKQAEFAAGETAGTLVSVADMEMYREKRNKSR